MEHHETLAAMERVCDHMLAGKWYVPTAKDTLFTAVINRSELEFQRAFPKTSDPAGGAPENYYQILTNSLAMLTSNANSLLAFAYSNEIFMLKASYESNTDAYVVTDVFLRPCVWETGIIRQITDALVNGLSTRQTPVKLRFVLDFGRSFLVSTTIEEMNTPEFKVFDIETKEEDAKKKKPQTYTMQTDKFANWKTAYTALDAKVKEAWPTTTLIDPANDRFQATIERMAKYPEWKKQAIRAGIAAKTWFGF